MSYISIYLQFAFISISIYSLLLYQYLSTACFYISIYLQLALYQYLSTACFYISIYLQLAFISVSIYSLLLLFIARIGCETLWTLNSFSAAQLNGLFRRCWGSILLSPWLLLLY